MIICLSIFLTLFDIIQVISQLYTLYQWFIIKLKMKRSLKNEDFIFEIIRNCTPYKSQIQQLPMSRSSILNNRSQCKDKQKKRVTFNTGTCNEQTQTQSNQYFNQMKMTKEQLQSTNAAKQYKNVCQQLKTVMNEIESQFKNRSEVFQRKGISSLKPMTKSLFLQQRNQQSKYLSTAQNNPQYSSYQDAIDNNALDEYQSPHNDRNTLIQSTQSVHSRPGTTQQNNKFSPQTQFCDNNLSHLKISPHSNRFKRQLSTDTLFYPLKQTKSVWLAGGAKSTSSSTNCQQNQKTQKNLLHRQHSQLGMTEKAQREKQLLSKANNSALAHYSRSMWSGKETKCMHNHYYKQVGQDKRGIFVKNNIKSNSCQKDRKQIEYQKKTKLYPQIGAVQKRDARYRLKPANQKVLKQIKEIQMAIISLKLAKK